MTSRITAIVLGPVVLGVRVLYDSRFPRVEGLAGMRVTDDAGPMAPFEDIRNLGKAIGMVVDRLEAGRRDLTVLALPPDLATMMRLELPTRGRRRERLAQRVAAAMVGDRDDMTVCWTVEKRLREKTLVRAASAPTSAVLAAYTAARQAGLPRCLVVPVQEAVRGAIDAAEMSASRTLLIDADEAASSFYIVHGGAVISADVVHGGGAEETVAAARRLLLSFTDIERIGLSGRRSGGGLVVLLRNSTGLPVDVVSAPGLMSDSLIPGALGMMAGRKYLPWVGPRLLTFPAVGPVRVLTRWTAVSAAALAVAAAGATAGTWHMTRMNSQLEQVRAERAQISDGVLQVRQLQGESAKLRVDLKERELSVAAKHWSTAIAALAVVTPPGAELRRVTLGSTEGHLAVAAMSVTDAMEVARRLRAQPVFKDVSMTKMEMRGTGGTSSVVEVTISARVALPDTGSAVKGGSRRGAGQQDTGGTKPEQRREP